MARLEIEVGALPALRLPPAPRARSARRPCRTEPGRASRGSASPRTAGTHRPSGSAGVMNSSTRAGARSRRGGSRNGLSFGISSSRWTPMSTITRAARIDWPSSMPSLSAGSARRNWLSSPKSYATGPRRRYLGSLSCWTSSEGNQPRVEAKRRNSHTDVRIAFAVLLERNRCSPLRPCRCNGSVTNQR